MADQRVTILAACFLAGTIGGAWWLACEPTTTYTAPPDEGGWVEEVAGLWSMARAGEKGPGIGEIGYAEGYEPATDARGVGVNLASAAQQGWNLYSSGHGPEAFLMDMQGKVHHRWHLPYGELPDAPTPDNDHQDNWRRVHLLEDGALLAIYGGLGLIKIDRDSKLIWHYAARAHHDMVVDLQGRILSLTRKERLIPKLNPHKGVIDDFVVVLTDDGVEISSLSVTECLLASRWSDRLHRLAVKEGDIMHTNSIHVLAGHAADRHPAFAAGNILLSSRNLDFIFVIDPRRKRVVWLMEGPWRGLHDPRELENGHILLFDNLAQHGSSRVVELDPLSGLQSWEYSGNPPQSFYSLFCGASARLANGNTLITETCAGRAFEVDGAGKIVWEFLSPHRAGKGDELVAALFEMERIHPERVKWLR